MFRLSKIIMCCLFLIIPLAFYSQATAQEQQLPIIGRPPIIAVDWNPKQDLIAVATAKEIWLYDAQLKDVAHLEVQIGLDQWNSSGDKQSISDWNIQKVKWAPNGQWLTMSIIVVTADGKSQSPIWQIWNWDGAQFTRIMDQFEYISAIKWSPNATQYGLTIGDQIFLFDTVSNQQIATFQAVELDWSSNSQHVAVVSLEALKVYNPHSFSIEANFPDSDTGLRFALWNSDNTKIAVVGQNRLYVWDFVTKKNLVNLIHFFPNPYPEMGYDTIREPIRGIAWRPNYDEITVLYDNIMNTQFNRISIWDVRNNVEIFSTDEGIRIGEMQWTPDGNKLLFSGSTTFKLAGLLNMTSHHPPPKQDFSITEWSYSPFQNHLIGYNRLDNLFSQLDSELFTTIKTFSGTASGIQAVDWSQDEKYFVIASYDELQIWDISRGEKQYENINHVGIWGNTPIWSADANYAALISSNPSSLFSHVCDSIRVWNIETGIPFINLRVNMGTNISWIGNTNMLALSEPRSTLQNCNRPDQFTIVDAPTSTTLLTLDHQQLVYLNWANKILNLYIQITSHITN